MNQLTNTPPVPAQAPTVSVNSNMYRSIADYHGSYFLLMVDPDAMMPQNPTARFYLHWAQPNLTANDQGVLTNSSPAFVPYARPQPPPSSDPHRYILYAFQQPQNLTSIPPAFAGYSDMNRTSFNVTEFISAANLGQPAAANYFFVENKTGVPPEFTASAGGQYPGGNGAAVTDGPGPMPSATGTSGMSASESPSASATGGATSASPTGEAATMGRSVNLALGVVGAVAFWGL